eukprot:gi/632987756/ref/XP_007882732.1/ PREDICTED: G-protein coupled bile acid receptor 1 [Callorhinchus milii]
MNPSAWSNSSAEPADPMYWLSAPLSAAVVLGNLLLVVGIAGNHRLHRSTDWHFLSLATAGLGVGVVLPSVPAMSFPSQYPRQICFFFHLFPNFLFLAFLGSLGVVQAHRYACVVHPLRYSSSWLCRSVSPGLLLAWLPALFYCSLPALGWHRWGTHTPPTGGRCHFSLIFPPAYIYLEIYGLLVPGILAVTGMAVRVLCVARGQIRSIARLHRAVASTSTAAEQQQMSVRHSRCVLAFALMVLLCWLPYILYIHVSLVAAVRHRGPSRTQSVLTCLGTSSAALIPVGLGLGNRRYTHLWGRLVPGLCEPRSPV